MRAGRLRHRLTFQSKVYSTNSYGEEVVTFTDQFTGWGSIEPLSGREYFSQETVQAESKVRVVIRYRSGVDTSWRISHGGLYYDIVDIINHDTRDRMMTIMCRQGVSEEQGSATTLSDVSGAALQFVDGTSWAAVG